MYCSAWVEPINRSKATDTNFSDVCAAFGEACQSIDLENGDFVEVVHLLLPALGQLEFVTLNMVSDVKKFQLIS